MGEVEKRLIYAEKLKNSMFAICEATENERIHIDSIIDIIDNAEDVNAMELPEVKPGDFIEWSNGVSTRLYRIGAIHICKNCVRYDIGDFCPVINHKNIVRIIKPEETEIEVDLESYE